MDTVRRAWNRFWFEPDAAQNLAFLRVVVALHALWILLSRDFAAVSGLQDFWVAVPLSVRLRYLLFPGHVGIEQVLQVGATVALVAALVGVYPRTACLLAGVLLYHMAPMDTIIWSPTPLAYGLTLSPVLLLALGAAPSGDAWVLWPRHGRGVSPSWEYGWPRRLAWILVAQIYAFAAIAKLEQAGLAWSSASNIRRWLLLFSLDEQRPYQALGRWLADRPGLCLAIGIGTVIFEWTFVLAVFSRLARRVLVPAGLILQVGILLAMNIHVGETWLLVTFVDWQVVARWCGMSYAAATPSIASAARSAEAASSV
jgi:hypothetical protein